MRLKLEQWLIIIFFGFNIILVSAISIAFYTQIKQSMLDRTLQQLQSINILKLNLIQQFLINKQKEIKYIVNSIDQQDNYPAIIEKLQNLNDLKQIRLISSDTTLLYPRLADTETFGREVPNGITAFNSSNPDYGYIFTYKADFTVIMYFGISNLQKILLERTGMGTSGESYLVNPDSTMQTQSRFFPGLNPNEIIVNTQGVRRSLLNEPGIGVYPDYRGVSIVGAYRLFEFDKIDWVLLTEIDFAEAMQPVIVIRDRFLLISGFIILLSFLISILIARNISKPIHQLFETLQKLSRGILPKRKLEEHVYVAEVQQITRAINQLITSLKRTSSFAKAIGKGRFDRNYKLLSKDDQLGKSIVAMRDQLVTLNQQNENLERATKRLLLETEEKERERISRDLHDGIGPLLTAIKMKITAEDYEERSEILSMIDDTLQEVRRISRNLMPSLIRDFGPGVALEQLIRDLNNNISTIEINFVNEVITEESKIDKQTGIALYRIGQEAINNSIKHGDASKIIMSLTEFDDHVNLFIRDNGKGFDKNLMYKTPGKGIHNIKERVNMLNGELIIESNQTGTEIEAIIPIS